MTKQNYLIHSITVCCYKKCKHYCTANKGVIMDTAVKMDSI